MANDLIDFEELIQVLMDLANDIEEGYKDTLVKDRHYTTDYALLDSVKTQVIAGDRAYEVTMTLKEYWKYLENDTKPHFPPPSALMRWVEIKPIFPRPDKNGRIPKPQQLAYLIGRKISIFGTKGTHGLQKTKDSIIPMYRERISAALGRDMVKYIRKVMQ